MISDYKYGPHERNILDIVIPDGLNGDSGLAFFIHGGGYIFGSKDEYKEYMPKLAVRQNIVCAALNYRYASATSGFDEIIEDITSALKAVKKLAADRGVNLTKMILNGGSAGAHLSLLYAYKYKDISPIKPVGVVSFCGVTDHTDTAFYGKNMCWYSEPDNWEQINNLWSACFKVKVTEKNLNEIESRLLDYSPVNFVDGNTVPTALYHGNADNMVPYSNALRLDAKLEAAGVTHKLVTGEGLGHNLFTDKDYRDKAFGEIDNFAELYLKATPHNS